MLAELLEFAVRVSQDLRLATWPRQNAEGLGCKRAETRGEQRVPTIAVIRPVANEAFGCHPEGRPGRIGIEAQEVEHQSRSSKHPRRKMREPACTPEIQ